MQPLTLLHHAPRLDHGADLARRATREEVHGVGLPQLRELFAALVEHQVPVYV
jgi:hypothetical protein